MAQIIFYDDGRLTCNNFVEISSGNPQILADGTFKCQGLTESDTHNGWTNEITQTQTTTKQLTEVE